MNKVQRNANILYGSMLVGSIITILSGWLIIYQDNHYQVEISNWLYFGAIIVLLVCLVVIVRKYAEGPFPAWLIAPTILLAAYGVYVTGIQNRELEYMFILPGAILLTAAITFAACFLPAKKQPKQFQGEVGPAPSILKPILTLALLVVVLPAVMAVHMRFQLLPKIRFYSPVAIEYDQPKNLGSYGVQFLGPGLYVQYGADLLGNYDYKYELNVHAYLVSSDSGAFDDTKQYVRRARFEHRPENGSVSFEVPDGGNDLFLSHEVVKQGLVQGGFDNYRPEPLRDILAKNENTQFAVEVIATVKKKPYDMYEERPVLKQIRQVVPMNYEQTGSEQREQYLKSQWVAMLSGKEWSPPAKPDGRQGVQTGEQVQGAQVSEGTGNVGQKEAEQPVQEVAPGQQSDSDEDEWGDL